MAYSTSNFSFPSISSKFENKALLNLRSYDSFDTPVDLSFKSVIDFSRLHQQSNVFAKDLISLNFEKKFVFGTQDYKWLKRAERCYIFSFFRGLTYGYFKNSTDLLGSNFNLFPGHLLFGHMLRCQSISYSSENNYYYHRLYPSFKFDDKLIALIEKEFPFLKGCFVEYENGKYTVFRADVANFMSRLSDQNLKELLIVDLSKDPSSILSLVQSGTTPLGNSAFIKRSSSEFNFNAPELDNTGSSKIKDNENEDIYFGFISNEKQNLNHNVSMWFGIANFIYLEDDTVNYFNESYYETVKRFDNDYKLVKYEVHANTFLKCSCIPDIHAQAESLKEE